MKKELARCGKRLVLPNGSSLNLGDGMPGTDALGGAGSHDEVNHHYGERE